MTTDREYGRPIQRHFLSTLQYCPAKHNQRQLGCSKCRRGRADMSIAGAESHPEAAAHAEVLAAGLHEAGKAGRRKDWAAAKKWQRRHAHRQESLRQPGNLPSYLSGNSRLPSFPTGWGKQPRALAELHATSGLHTEYAGQRFTGRLSEGLCFWKWHSRLCPVLSACLHAHRDSGLGLRRPGAEHPGAPARPEQRYAGRPAQAGHEPLRCRHCAAGGQQFSLHPVAAVCLSVLQVRCPGEYTAAEPLLQASGRPLKDAPRWLSFPELPHQGITM